MPTLPLIKPRRLAPGACIGVTAPSAPTHVSCHERYQKGLANLRRLGFKVVEGDLVASGQQQGYRTGTPRQRAEELMALFLRPEVDAIMTTIGGANSSSLLPYLDFAAIRANPKWFIGYSDVTALHMALYTQAGLSSLYGPAVIPTFGEWPDGFEYSNQSFLDAVQRHVAGPRRLFEPECWSREAPRWTVPEARDPAQRIWRSQPGWRTLRPGIVEAEAVPLNLNTACALAGTAYFPNLTGKIVLLEEMAGPYSRLERNLRQLELMGVFDNAAAVIFSKIEFPDSEQAPFDSNDLLLEIIGSRPIPVVTDFDCGHTHPMLALALGCRLRVEATELVELMLLEPMLAS
ncbi:S66 peptidase family protein [Parachitinimonas caeni]|uniref:LD-carboxypeptidase n=1 Tax=Parachitinimonas caeni TaxID=3031301 RepID=A0ABT7DUE3_9NEIS|nr:S66 peptidase family protein [Parachitinimonas caeni]MDK2123690.1 LD-carboxypeptidase [Parachitinimonas caeni]